MFTIHKLNSIAKSNGLKLYRSPEGYFYWVGITDHVNEKLNKIGEGKDLGVYVFRFTHLSEKNWLREIDIILDKLNNVEL